LLRIVTGLVAMAAVLGSLGCAGGDTAGSGEPVVTKAYFEDLSGDPDDEEYRYWDYTFDFGDRAYLARVYTDEPEVAYVDRIDEGGIDDDAVDVDGVTVDLTGDTGAVQRRDSVERANLRTVLDHLSRNGWSRIVFHTLVGDAGYKPLPLP
jgi:hypothetical protein